MSELKKYETNRCANCGKKREQHLRSALVDHWDCAVPYTDSGTGYYRDSGLQAIQDNAVNNIVAMEKGVDKLRECKGIIDMECDSQETIDEIQEVINLMEQEISKSLNRK